jgi:hypothetical protein
MDLSETEYANMSWVELQSCVENLVRGRGTADSIGSTHTASDSIRPSMRKMQSSPHTRHSTLRGAQRMPEVSSPSGPPLANLFAVPPSAAGVNPPSALSSLSPGPSFSPRFSRASSVPLLAQEDTQEGTRYT